MPSHYQGNEAFNEGDNRLANELYSDAITEAMSVSVADRPKNLLAVLHCNRAAALLKLGRFEVHRLVLGSRFFST